MRKLLFFSFICLFYVHCLNAQNLPIAYVDVDTLILNYEYAKDMNSALVKKQEILKAKLDNEYKFLKKQEEDFKNKVDNNTFLTMERAEQELKRIQKLNTDLEEKSSKLAEEFANEQQIHNEQLTNTIKVYLKEYNQNKNYHFIFTNTGIDNILFAKEEYNITHDFLKFLNEKYKLLSKE